MNDPSAKQQIVDRIKKSTNILVTLSKNPSVDELSAALGLAMMLDKLDKHVTAVFSGRTPPAIEFLEPSKTFENTVDSLRDFIIALDKEKADRLRYRVEDDDMVRIFITPYRTRITEEDLHFAHGDFNVELVLALGVEKQTDLDEAIAAHGKILHDATVATFSAGGTKSDLGSIDWQDASASSLCEMLVAVSESLKSGLLDQQISTALLTGIVAATNRFSNSNTSSKSMTMAAQLMAAGANQQLIASKLEASSEISSEPAAAPAVDSVVEHDNFASGASKKIHKEKKKPDAEPKEKAKSLGEMTIEHEQPADASANPSSPTDPVAEPDQASPDTSNQPPQESPESTKPPYVESATIEEHDKHKKRIDGEQALDEALAELGNPADQNTKPDIQDELANTVDSQTASEPELSYIETNSEDSGETSSSQTTPNSQISGLEDPSTDQAFDAVTEDPEDDHRYQEETSRNKTIMNHSDQTPDSTPETAPLDYSGSLSDIESQVKSQEAVASDHPDAVRQEIDSIFEPGQTAAAAVQTSAQPAESLLPPPPPLPDFSNLPPLPPNLAPPEIGQLSQNNTSSPAPPPNPNDPTQFQIPGQ